MNYPRCPHCGFKFDDEHIWHGGDDCEFPTTPGHETADCFDCPGCGEELHVEVEWTPEFYFVDEDGIEFEYGR